MSKARPPAPARRLIDEATATGPYLLPDEKYANYALLNEEIFEELAPQTSYQARLVQNLADFEWEIERHRRLVAAHVRTEFRSQTQSASRRGGPGFTPADHTAERQAPDLGEELLADDPARRQEAERRLAALHVTRAEITAAAYDIAHNQIAWHERQIADLERRRRAVYADYLALRERQSAKRAIPDAEIVG